MEPSEAHIIRLLQQNDKSVIATLYDKYAAALFGVVVKIVGSEVMAEDVLQEAFVKIWTKGHTYDSTKGTLFTWMLNIARNLAIDKTRTARFRQKEKTQSIDQLVSINKEPGIDYKTEHIGLRNIVTKLEEKYRVVLDLIYFEGYTQKEVEEHLNIPLGTVKTRLRIALRELRKLFEEQSVTLFLLMITGSYG